MKIQMMTRSERKQALQERVSLKAKDAKEAFDRIVQNERDMNEEKGGGTHKAMSLGECMDVALSSVKSGYTHTNITEFQEIRRQFVTLLNQDPKYAQAKLV